MEPVAWLGALGAVGLAALLLFLYAHRPARVPGIPNMRHRGPCGFLGAIPDMKDNLAVIHDWRVDLFKTFKGTFAGSSPFDIPYVNVADPACVEHILRSNFDNYVKEGVVDDIFEELLGDGIFRVDGDLWREQRKIASHMFALKVMRTDIATTFVRHGVALLERLARVPRGEAVDIAALFFRFTMDSMADVAFGIELDSINKEEVPFARAFDFAQQHITMRGIFPFWKLRRFLRVGDEREFSRCIRIIDDFAYSIIRQRMRENLDHLRKHPSLLSLFIAHFQESNAMPSEKFLRDIAVNFLLAGRDTTACALSWLTYCLLTHPDEAAIVQREIDARLPDGGEATATYETFKDMPALEAAIFEALRLFPSVPADFKRCIKSDRLPDGSVVPAGAGVGWYPYVMARLETLWGPDAGQFRPARWRREDGTINKPSPFLYPVFNAGPRTCLGKEMAVLEAKVMASLLFKRFRLELVPGHRVTYEATLQLPMKNGLRVTLVPRSGAR